MSKLLGLFDSFDSLDQISAEAIASWLKPAPQLTLLENYLANRILYPQAIALTGCDIKIDLAILREALKISSPFASDSKTNAFLGNNPFLNVILRKILIPVRFLNFIPDLSSLTWAFIDALLPDRKKEDWFEDLWTVVLTDDTDEIVGSVVLAQFEDNSGAMDLSVQGKNYKIHSGSLMVIPCSDNRCEITYRLQKGKVLGKQINAIEVYGGRLGLIVDGRTR